MYFYLKRLCTVWNLIRKKNPKQKFKTQIKKTKKNKTCSKTSVMIFWATSADTEESRSLIGECIMNPSQIHIHLLNRFSRPWENFVNDNLIKTKHILFAKVHWHCNKINQLYKHFLKFVVRILFILFILFNR